MLFTLRYNAKRNQIVHTDNFVVIFLGLFGFCSFVCGPVLNICVHKYIHTYYDMKFFFLNKGG